MAEEEKPVNPFMRRIKHPNDYRPPDADGKEVNRVLWGQDVPPAQPGPDQSKLPGK